MRNESWMAAFAHELEARSMPPGTRAEIVVETEGHLAESAGTALDQFGPPAEYAASLATAIAGRPQHDQRGTTGRVVVHLRDVSRSYRRVHVLRALSLTVHHGQIVALLGANGAGKSTLLRVIAGLEPADGGVVDVRGSVGYVPQAGGLDAYLRPDEHFELFGAAAGCSRRAARQEGRRLALELGWDTTVAPIVGRLSGGTRQKLAVITGMLAQPDLLLLDEPYQGMDADSTRRFWELLWEWSERGRAALVSTHIGDALSRADDVVELAVPR